MRIVANNIKCLSLVTAFAAAALLGGCGGVQLEGPGFEALGITSNKKNDTEPKVPDRAPLVIPPKRAQLPQPQTQPQPQQATASAQPQNWPTDPESLLKAEKTQAEQKKKDYADKGDWSKNADISEFEKLMDPLDRQPGIFSGGDELSDKYRDTGKYEN